MPDRAKTTSGPDADGTKKPPRPRTKAQILDALAQGTGLDKKAVGDVLIALTGLAASDLARLDGPGKFTIPGVVTIKVKLRGATREKHTVNPLSGKPLVIPARPERRVVNTKAVKSSSDLVIW